MKEILENKKLLAGICGGGAIIVVLAVVLVLQLVVRPNQLYQEATEQFVAGNYVEAYESLQKVPESKNDTAELLPYYAAHAAFAEGNYSAAAEQFAALGNQWEDCPNYAAYSQAQVHLGNKEYGEAYNAFAALGGFLDSADMLPECRYRLAVDLLAENDYTGALERFSALAGYKDSDTQAKECSYQLALQTLEAGDYSEAYNAFVALGEYKDAVDMLSECRYRKAGDLMEAGDLAGALERYDALTGYKDSDTQAKECRYQQAAALAAQNTLDSLTQASALYTQLGDYKDAVQQAEVVAAAIIEAQRVPYTHSAKAYFDIDCTNPSSMQLKAYKIAVRDGQRAKVFSLPSGLTDVTKIRLNSSEYAQNYPIESNSCNMYVVKASSNGFTVGSTGATTYTVKNGWKDGDSAQWTGINNGQVYMSAVRFGSMAIVLDYRNNVAIHSDFLRKVRSGTVVNDYDGMVGGAIIFDDYNYIDLSPYTFDSASNSGASFSGGGSLSVSNWLQDGVFSENYKGYDIYVLQGWNNRKSVYCQVWPDVFIETYMNNDPVAGKALLKTLIDNFHRV